MLKLDLPEDVENRLDLLSLSTGHTLQFYVLEAVMEYLDDLEARHTRLEAMAREPVPVWQQDSNATLASSHVKHAESNPGQRRLHSKNSGQR